MKAPERRKEDLERVRKAMLDLGEHFDTVHILVTRHEPAVEDGTIHISLGCGNWYARYGQVIEWIRKQDAHNHHKEKQLMDEEKEDPPGEP